MSMRRRAAVGRLIFRACRLTFVDADPGTSRPFAVAAPHTSYMDGVLMFALAWQAGLQPVALIEKKFFVGPLGELLQRMGTVPVDRRNPGDLVRSMTARLAEDPSRTVAVAPEGTRGKVEYWKSGFYRIAYGAGVPITLGFIDMNTRTCGLGPTVRLTGDVAADMDVLRAFYAGKAGWWRGNEVVPRLRREPRDAAEIMPRER